METCIVNCEKCKTYVQCYEFQEKIATQVGVRKWLLCAACYSEKEKEHGGKDSIRKSPEETLEGTRALSPGEAVLEAVSPVRGHPWGTEKADATGFDGKTTHYGSGPYEVIKIIEHHDLGFHTGNAVKYILRAGKKEGVSEASDLLKAINYLERKLRLINDGR